MPVIKGQVYGDRFLFDETKVGMSAIVVVDQIDTFKDGAFPLVLLEATMKTKLLFGIAVTVVAVGAIAWLSKGLFKDSSSSGAVRIGVVTTLTGNAASWGAMQRNATKLAVDHINAAGGIKGRPIEAVLEDDQVLGWMAPASTF